MPMKNWVAHRFRQDGGDQSDGDANPTYEEVTATNGLPVQIVGGGQRLYSYEASESLTVSSTALPLGAIREGRTHALITVAVDAVRFWLDGSSPTATVGHILNVGDTLELDGRAELDGVRLIRVTSDATVSVSYANEVQ